MNSKKLNTKLELILENISEMLDEIEFNDIKNSEETNSIFESITELVVDIIQVVEADEKMSESGEI